MQVRVEAFCRIPDDLRWLLDEANGTAETYTEMTGDKRLASGVIYARFEFSDITPSYLGVVLASGIKPVNFPSKITIKMKTSALITVLSAGARVAAHGYVSNIVVNGVYYRGWNPGQDPYSPNPPIGVGWETPNLSNGFVRPEEASTDAIICHSEATPARGYASVAAGDRVYLQWQPSPWPESHHGPVLVPLSQTA